jgi:uncharacterized protein (DUF2225 family)
MTPDKTFRTSNYALCGYLELNGLKFVSAEKSKDRKGKDRVDFIFEDTQNKGLDLEIEFRHSSEKRYRDSLFFYRKIISDILNKEDSNG